MCRNHDRGHRDPGVGLTFAIRGLVSFLGAVHCLHDFLLLFQSLNSDVRALPAVLLVGA